MGPFLSKNLHLQSSTAKFWGHFKLLNSIHRSSEYNIGSKMQMAKGIHVIMGNTATDSFSPKCLRLARWIPFLLLVIHCL